MSELNETFTVEELKALRDNPELRSLFVDEGEDFPQPSNKDSLLKLFRDVLNFGVDDYSKSSKSGNLKDWELGKLPLDTRHYLSIANYADTENLSSVADFLRGRADVLANTSLSRGGFLLKLIVTQRKFSGIIEPKKFETKKSFFGGEKVVESGGEE